MASCLGLFIEDNLIKYAKISKENDDIKVESHGIKFYEQDLENTIEQIVNETFSYNKTPISINTFNEKYTNTEIFSLLSEADQKKSVKTEFEYFCSEAGKNRLALEYRDVMSDSIMDKDKKNVLYAYSEKGSIAERIQLLDKYKLVNLSPVALSILNLQEKTNGNSLIINMEEKTEVTTVVNGKPVKVDIIEEGMKEILTKIAERENSMSKAYEICKNTTLYTASSQNLQTESNEYLEIIVPVMFKITEEIQKIIQKNEIEIENIYLTGAGTVINNVDLYFQENFLNTKCEILTPFFANKTSLKLNIKDYIEVNSAISLAIQGLDRKNKEINFVNKSEAWEKLTDLLNSDISSLGKKTLKSKGSKQSKKVNIDLRNIKDINCWRFAYGAFIMLAIYVGTTAVLHNRINSKTVLAQEVIDDTKTKTATVTQYTSLIKTRTQKYQSILEQLQKASEQANQAIASKNAIPNLLHEIMYIVPKQVQILSIENSKDKHIVINAQTEEYQYLGYLKTELQNKAMLTNVTATSGKRVNGQIQVTIEGDLPY